MKAVLQKLVRLLAPLAVALLVDVALGLSGITALEAIGSAVARLAAPCLVACLAGVALASRMKAAIRILHVLAYPGRSPDRGAVAVYAFRPERSSPGTFRVGTRW